jgi:predicted ester cyclase
MSSEQSKAVVRRAFDEPWRGTWASSTSWLRAITSDTIRRSRSPSEAPRTSRTSLPPYLVAFPDARMTVTMQLAEGDLVATRWVGRGTHEGDFYGMILQVEGASARVRA